MIEPAPPQSVMLLPFTAEGRLILHLRDDKEGVLHPDCWAGFGGAIEKGEEPEDALRREMAEETGIHVNRTTFLTAVVDEPSEGGRGEVIWIYTCHGELRLEDIDLAEGVDVGAFRAHEVATLRLSPFVRSALAASGYLPGAPL